MQVPHKIVQTFKICNRETSVYSKIIEGDNIKKGSNSLLIRTSSNVINKAIHVEMKITITDCLFMCSEPFCFLYGVFYTNCHKLRRIERGKLSSSGARSTKFSLQI